MTYVFITLTRSHNATRQCGAIEQCLHGSTCASGVTCLCREGDRGQDCGITALQFTELSYLEYLPQLQSTGNTIAVEFATVSQKGLIIYYSAGIGRNAFFMDVTERKLRFTFIGDNTERTSVISRNLVSDGAWHRADVEITKLVCILLFYI